MTDPTLQERLRERLKWIADDNLRGPLVEAADALDAAQAEVADRDARITGLEAMLCNAQAEVARLREALGVILGTTGTSAIHDRAVAALGRTP